jgi:hypothetical protein
MNMFPLLDIKSVVPESIIVLPVLERLTELAPTAKGFVVFTANEKALIVTFPEVLRSMPLTAKRTNVVPELMYMEVPVDINEDPVVAIVRFPVVVSETLPVVVIVTLD